MSNPSSDDLGGRCAVPCAELSAVLLEASRSLMPTESGPRSWGRRLEIDKDLAWRAYRMAHAGDFAGIVRVLPGARGLSLVERALAKSGCDAALCARFRAARTELARLLDEAGVDRRTLGAIVAGGGDDKGDRRERARARSDARRAMSRLWGIEARASVRMYMIAPGADGLLDVVYFNLVDGFRRLRPGPPWRVVSPAIRFEPGAGAGGAEGALHQARAAGGPLVPGDPQPPLVAELTDRAASDCIRASAADGGDLFFYGEASPSARRLAFAWGERLVGVGPAHAPNPDAQAVLRSAVQFPISKMTMRLCFHRDVPRGSDPSAAFFITLDAVGRPGSFERPTRLALDSEIDSVDPRRTPRALAKRPGSYARMLELGASALGSVPGDFRDGFELTVTDPPMLSVLAMQWRLSASA
jgi:hypothetical protein